MKTEVALRFFYVFKDTGFPFIPSLREPNV